MPQTRKNEAGGPGADIKKHNFVFQPIDTVNAPKVQELIQLIDCTWTTPYPKTLSLNGRPKWFAIAAREDPNLIRETFPPSDKRVPMGDVFTSCNWIMRDGSVANSSASPSPSFILLMFGMFSQCT